MKIKRPVSFVLGLLLIGFALYLMISLKTPKGLIPFLIGGSLVYSGIRPGRNATLIFGHTLVVVGCLLTTWGIYLLPHSEP
jgi:hypothetical protein